jgi:hypothetical protein
MVSALAAIMRLMLTIYIDAGACPVKDEVYRVALVAYAGQDLTLAHDVTRQYEACQFLPVTLPPLIETAAQPISEDRGHEIDLGVTGGAGEPFAIIRLLPAGVSRQRRHQQDHG